MAQRRGEATREHLLDVAQQLYGERGVANVSMREIRIVSGARNTAAIQFHFGDREGLLKALTARHVPRIGERQRALWEAIVAEGATTDRIRLVEVLVRPTAEYLALGPGERAWVKIMGELAASPDIPLTEMVPITPDPGVEAGRALYGLMRASMPGRIARERLFVVARIVVYMCADRARIEDDPDARERMTPSPLFTENLVDMVCGALFAPVSETLAKSR